MKPLLKLKVKLNCLIFALMLWFHNHMRTTFHITRSRGLRGLIPHFGHSKEHNGYVFVEDYIPRKRKDSFVSDGDSFVLFDGMYRVRIYELKVTTISDTLFGARAEAIRRTKDINYI